MRCLPPQRLLSHSTTEKGEYSQSTLKPEAKYKVDGVMVREWNNNDKKFWFFFYPNNFNLKKPIYLLTHTSTHTKIHFLHIVRQFLEHACSIDIYKPYTNSNCITIDFEKNRISNVISFNFQYLSDF